MQTLSALTITHIINPDMPSKLSKDEVLNLIPNSKPSIREEFESIIWSVLKTEDKDLHKYLVNKLWIGEKLMYDNDIEERLAPYINKI